MSSDVPARSIFSSVGRQGDWASYLRLVRATCGVKMRTNLFSTGVLAYVLSWLMLPVMDMILMAYIYRDNPALRNYAIVASAGVAVLFGLIFNGGEALDSARRHGLLGNLFLSPMPRYVWLAGFQAFTFLETLFNATLAVGYGVLAFGIDLDINVAALAVTLILLAAAMWGASMILSSIGLYTRNANFLSNLLFPLLTLFAGTMYPVDRMTGWIRIPARMLPFAYANEALVGSLTLGASVADLANKLIPLGIFALVLPVIGIALFRRADTSIRRWGTLEIV